MDDYAKVYHYAGTNIMYCSNIDFIGKEGYDPSLLLVWEDAVYEYSRLKFQDAA